MNDIVHLLVVVKSSGCCPQYPLEEREELLPSHFARVKLNTCMLQVLVVQKTLIFLNC